MQSVDFPLYVKCREHMKFGTIVLGLYTGLHIFDLPAMMHLRWMSSWGALGISPEIKDLGYVSGDSTVCLRDASAKFFEFSFDALQAMVILL